MCAVRKSSGKASDSISQMQSDSHQMPSDAIRCHRMPSDAIRCHRMPSEAVAHLPFHSLASYAPSTYMAPIDHEKDPCDTRDALCELLPGSMVHGG